MFRRRKPVPPPEPDVLTELVRTWRNRAADLATGNLNVRDENVRIVRGREASTYLHAAHELERALEET